MRETRCPAVVGCVPAFRNIGLPKRAASDRGSRAQLPPGDPPSPFTALCVGLEQTAPILLLTSSGRHHAFLSPLRSFASSKRTLSFSFPTFTSPSFISFPVHNMKLFSSAGAVLLPLASLARATDLRTDDEASVQSVSAQYAYGLMSYYKNNATNLPKEEIGFFPKPHYWWEAGAVWGGMIEYTKFTGDESYVKTVQQALTANYGPNNDILLPWKKDQEVSLRPIHHRCTARANVPV